MATSVIPKKERKKKGPSLSGVEQEKGSLGRGGEGRGILHTDFHLIRAMTLL